MNSTIGLLFGSAVVLASGLGVMAQDYGLAPETPIAAPLKMAVQGDGSVQYYAQGPSIWGTGGHFNYLTDPSVMKDLELVDDQMSEITDIRGDFNKRRQEIWKELTKANKVKDQATVKEARNRLADLQAKHNEALSNVLLPHQLERIKQVARQIQTQRMGGLSGAFQYGTWAKELDITDEQRKKLAEIQKKMREDIAAKTKEIRAAASKRAMDQLTAEQKSKFKELTGEEFKRNPKDWQEHRQRTLTRLKKN